MAGSCIAPGSGEGSLNPVGPAEFNRSANLARSPVGFPVHERWGSGGRRCGTWGERRSSVDNPVSSKIPLDLDFCTVFTDIRSGERTQTGAMRAGFGLRVGVRSSSSTGRSGAGTGNSVHRPPQTGSTGNRRQRGVGVREQATASDVGSRPGSRATVGDGRPAGPLGRPGGSARQTGPTGNRGRRGSGSEPKDLGPPQLASVRRFRLAPEPMARATGSAWNGGNGPHTGKPVSGTKTDIARRAARHDGRCDWSSRRLTPDVRSVVDLFRECPARVRR